MFEVSRQHDHAKLFYVTGLILYLDFYDVFYQRVFFTIWIEIPQTLLLTNIFYIGIVNYGFCLLFFSMFLNKEYLYDKRLHKKHQTIINIEKLRLLLFELLSHSHSKNLSYNFQFKLDLDLEVQQDFFILLDFLSSSF